MKQEQMMCRHWAEQQFAEAELGDKRRSRRLVEVAAALAESPGGTLPSVLPEWAQLKAAYRLLATDEVTHEAVQKPHWQKTRDACGGPCTYLMIEDTTDIDLSNLRGVEGLGWIGDGGGWGFYLHTTLALRVQGWNADDEPMTQAVGLLNQKWWVRKHDPRHNKETKRQRMQRPRESQRWAEVFRHVVPPEDAYWIYVTDREGDIYETFLRCENAGVHFVIRAEQARAQADEAGTTFEAVRQAPCRGRFSVFLRARPGMAARTATVQIRSTTVTLRPPWRPGGRAAPVQVNVVEAREVDAPEDVEEPIHWILITDEPCESFAECRRVIGVYAQRWFIEEYHKGLKSGVGMEATQLSTADRILALCGVLAIVAVRLVGMKLLASTRPADPLGQDALDSQALTILEAKYGKPEGGWTNLTTLICIARLGGFLARKNDGTPGWQTIWRGWQRLMLMHQAFSIATELNRCG